MTKARAYLHLPTGNVFADDADYQARLKAWQAQFGDHVTKDFEPLYRRNDVAEDCAKLVEKRAAELVELHGDYEPDTNATNLPEWVEAVVEELEDMAKALRAMGESGT